MPTILVTGGCGFIGSHFIRTLLAQYPDDRIVNLDALTYAANPENLKDVTERFGGRYRFIHADITDTEAIARVFSEECPEFVANLAAESHVDRSLHDPKLFLQTNVLGLSTLLDAARERPVKRFLHVSTDEVYGVAEGEREFDERDALAPKSPYAASKAAGDLLALAYHETYGIPIVISRGSNAYGPNQYPEKFLPVVITNLFDNISVPIYPPGTQVREWTHVEDHASALDTILRKGSAGEIYNFGSGERRQNLEMAREILRMFGKEEDSLSFIDARPGHDARYALKSDKIKTLGWAPRYTLDTALSDTVAWYREHEAWWRPLKASSGYRAHHETHYGMSGAQSQ